MQELKLEEQEQLNSINFLFLCTEIFGDFIDSIKERLRKDMDLVIAVTGDEGLGKSSLAIILGFLLDDNFDLKRNVAYIPDADEIKKQFNFLPRYSCFVIDEAIKSLYKLGWFSNAQQMITKMYMTERWQNKVSIVVLPRFRDLTESFRNHKVDIWIHVLKRGLAFVYMKDSDKDNKDPWHFDENLKVKAKIYKKLVRDVTMEERIKFEMLTKNYFFYFTFPKLPRRIENRYKIFRERSRKENPDEEVMRPQAQKYKEKLDKMVEILKAKGIKENEIKKLMKEKDIYNIQYANQKEADLERMKHEEDIEIEE